MHLCAVHTTHTVRTDLCSQLDQEFHCIQVSMVSSTVERRHSPAVGRKESGEEGWKMEAQRRGNLQAQSVRACVAQLFVDCVDIRSFSHQYLNNSLLFDVRGSHCIVLLGGRRGRKGEREMKEGGLHVTRSHSL